MIITVFTPTYNRASLLNRVYESLLHQSNSNFEWIVVDDGSTDSTETLVNDFIEQQKMPITYFKQENKGKHFAINKGVQLAKGAYLVILDSDDALTPNAIESILECVKIINEKPNIGGIVGRKIYFDQQLIGQLIGKNIISNSLDIRYKQNIIGDLAEIYTTEVLREFPFPEIENEKFCPEALIWNRIAQKYNLLFTDEMLYQVEYMQDGLTAKIVKIRMTSPIASMLCYSELASYRIPFIEKVKANINFWRFSFNSNLDFMKKNQMVNTFFSLIGFPIGFIMHQKDIKKWL